MGQYDEEKFLLNFFGEKNVGVVVEIGSANPDLNSNSKYLIDKGWSALLVEPNTTFYKRLKDFYSENPLIFIENVCAHIEDIDSVKFYEFDQVSTMDECFRERANRYYGNKEWKNYEGESKYGYNETIIKAVKTSKLIEKYFKNIDFLSIDTEGSDINVIMGIDFDNVYIKLLCHESQNNEQVFNGKSNVNLQIHDYLINKGFEKVHENIGNIFYENKKKI